MRTRRTGHVADIDPGDRVVLPTVEHLKERCFTVEHVTFDLSHAWPRVNLWIRNGPFRDSLSVHYTEPAVIWRTRPAS